MNYTIKSQALLYNSRAMSSLLFSIPKHVLLRPYVAIYSKEYAELSYLFAAEKQR